MLQMAGALTLQFFRIVQLPMAAVFIESSLKHLSSMIIDHKVIKNTIQLKTYLHLVQVDVAASMAPAAGSKVVKALAPFLMMRS